MDVKRTLQACLYSTFLRLRTARAETGDAQVGGYSSNGNVHENDILSEMLSSILWSSINPLLTDTGEILLFSDLNR
jgi:hypothetical protein